MRAWLALFSAIVCEVAGTLALKIFGIHSPVLALLVTGLAITVSYVLLSLAFRKIPVAVAFAIWEALGLALITVLGVALLGEHLSPVQWTALGGLLLGARMLHLGSALPDPSQVPDASGFLSPSRRTDKSRKL